MPIPASPDEYQSPVEDVVEKMMEDARFVGYVEALVESLLDGSPDDRVKALRAFGTLSKKLAERKLQELNENHFEVDADNWEHA